VGRVFGLCVLLVGTLVVAQAQAASVSVKITSAPPATTTSTDATISFESTGAKKTSCKLDGGDWDECSSPVHYSGLSAGTHQFVVRAQSGDAKDKDKVSWEIVSGGASALTVTSSIANGSTLSGSVTWQATPSTSVSAVDFYIDGVLKWTEKLAPYVFNGDGSELDTKTLSDGSHVLKVVASSSSGAKAEVSAAVQVANAAPPPPPTAPFTVTSSIANGSTLAGSVVWTATPSTTVSKVDFYIDGALKWTENAAPYVFNGDGSKLDTKTLTNASHVLKLVATPATGGATAQLSVTVQVANGTAPPSSTNSAGHISFMAPKANSSMVSFIENSTSTQQQWMRDHWRRAIVEGGYWDSKLSWYPNAWAYLDSYAIYNGSSTATQHPDWILKDSAGRKLYIPFGCSGSSCPQYAADIGNSAWRQDYINRAKALIAKGYKGIFADDVNMDMHVSDGSGQLVVPIDPRTGQPMTDAAWKSYFATFMEQLRAAISAEIVHNAIWFAGGGLHDGTQPEIAREIKAADLYHMERGFNDPGLTGGTGSWSVYAMLRFIDTVHSYGRHVVIASQTGDATAAEYNLAGYFLINDGRDYVGSYIGAMPSNWWRGYATDLGDAKGGRYQWNGVWRRDFTRGFVLLNEPGASTKTLSLGGSYKNTAGNTVTSVTLGAARGAVLTIP
jgi:Hypothetical glycosyl hydrolase family 15/Bacterial Ig domain